MKQPIVVPAAACHAPGGASPRVLSGALFAMVLAAAGACYVQTNDVCLPAGHCLTPPRGTTPCYLAELDIWVDWPTGVRLRQDADFPGVTVLPYACWDVIHRVEGKDGFVRWPATRQVEVVEQTVDPVTCTWSVRITTRDVSCEARTPAGNPCNGTFAPPPGSSGA